MPGLTSSDWVAIGLFVLAAVFTVIGWLVQRFFTSTDEKLTVICEQVTEANQKITQHAAYREGDRRDIDSAHEVLIRHAAVLGEHAVKLSEHEGHFSSILNSKQVQ